MPTEPHGVVFQDVVSNWPLLVEAAPGHHLEISFTVDGETILHKTCTRMAVLSCTHEEQEVFGTAPWVDRKQQGVDEERARITELLRTLDYIPGWDGTFDDLPRALAELVSQRPPEL